MKNITITWLTVGFIVGWMPAGYALRALDEDKQPIPVRSAPTAEVTAEYAPMPAQIEAARSIPGIQIIDWDNKTGVPSSLRAQDLETVNLGGKGITLKVGASCEERAIAMLDRLSSVYCIRDASKEFKAYRVDDDDLDFRHVRVEQRYNGLPVFGADLIVHFDAAGKAYQVNGRYIPNIAVDTIPVLKPEKAVSIAQAQLARWGKPAGTVPKQPSLVIYAHAGATPRLAYEFIVIYRVPDPGNWRFWVDAKDGAILKCYNDIQSLNDAKVYGHILVGEGGGEGRIDEVTGCTDYPNAIAKPPGASAKADPHWYWYLKNQLKPWTVWNADCTSSFPDSGYTAWRDDDGGWFAGVHDEIEFSAAYNIDKVMDYYDYYVGRKSYDNASANAMLYVHYYYLVYYNNAFWDPYNHCFCFYDGDGKYGGLSVLDMVAHEFTHAVDQFTANLIYEGESGALNESFSDIFAAAIEFYYQPDGRSYYPDRRGGGYSDWLFGEDITYPSATAMRDMRNPWRYSDPCKYHGQYWHDTTDTSPGNDNGGVHFNNGVQNHMFYLLSEGGSGNDEDGVSYNVTGIGVANAMLVAQRALLHYCTRSTDFSAIRGAWMSAANDLSSSYATSVNAAWAAVGITEYRGNQACYQYAAAYYENAMYCYQLWQLTGNYAYANNYYYYIAYAYYYYELYIGQPVNIALAYGYYHYAYAAYYYYAYYGYYDYAEYYYDYYIDLAYYYYYGGS